jgi:hypothetical protein
MSLPDKLVDFAKEKGVLTEEWTSSLFRNALIDLARQETNLPPGFPRELLGAVNPKMYGSVKTNGDIIGPFHEEWEET